MGCVKVTRIGLVWFVLCFRAECRCRTHCIFFFFKQKTAFEMRISNWSSDVCSSDLSVMLLFSSGFYVVHGRTAKHIIIEAQCECRHAAARCLFVSGIISGSETLFSPWQCGAAQACVEPQ